MPSVVATAGPDLMRSPVYLIYGRFSGEGQRGNSSKDRQIDIEHYRKRASELNLPLDNQVRFDDALSGFYGDNLEGELGKILDDIESGDLAPGSVIGVESHSRLGRLTPADAAMQYFEVLKKKIGLDFKGKKLRTWESINGNMAVLFEDLIDIFVAHKHSADLAEAERRANDIKRAKIIAGQSAMMKGGPGMFVGGRCPLWLVPLKEPIVDQEGHKYWYGPKDDAMTRVIQMIFDWAEEGIGHRKISERLNDMRIPRMSHWDKPPEQRLGWSGEMVGNLLRSRAVIGEWQPNVSSREDEYGNKLRHYRNIPVQNALRTRYYWPIIDRAQFQRVADSVKGRLSPHKTPGKPVARGGRRGDGFANLFMGLATCAYCGGTLRQRTASQPRHKYLKCSHHISKTVFPEGHPLAGKRCENKQGFRYDKLESMVLHLFFIRDLISKLIKEHRADIAPLENRLVELQDTIIRRKRSIQLREIELDEMTDLAERATHRAETRRLRAEVTELEREAGGLATQIRYHERTNSGDYLERVRVGIDRLNTDDPIERENARSKLNGLLKERMRVRLGTDGVMQVAFAGVLEAGVIGLTQEGEIIHYGHQAAQIVIDLMRTEKSGPFAPENFDKLKVIAGAFDSPGWHPLFYIVKRDGQWIALGGPEGEAAQPTRRRASTKLPMSVAAWLAKIEPDRRPAPDGTE